MIGRGSCGIVYKGLNRTNGKLVAIKQVSLDNIKEDAKGSVKNEIRLLKDFEHERIVKYLDCIQSEEHLNIVLEYVENGSLDSLIKKFGKIPESLVTIYVYQVLEGLVFLHEKGIIHRDIKGGNILTTKEGEVKLADFSVATTKLNQEQNNSQISINNMSFAGTPYWMAPEVIQEEKKVTSACDIWSLGCTVIELLTEKPPYYEFKNPLTALFKIVNEKNPPIPENLSDDLNDFLRLCFEIDHEKRSSARELLDHPWLRKAKEAEERNHAASAEKQIMQVEHQTSTERDVKAQEAQREKLQLTRMGSEEADASKKESKRNSLKASNQIHIAIKDLARQAHGANAARKDQAEGKEPLAESPEAKNSTPKLMQSQSSQLNQDSKRKQNNPSLITSKSHSHSTSKMSQRSIQNAGMSAGLHLQSSGLPPGPNLNLADQISSQDAQAPGGSINRNSANPPHMRPFPLAQAACDSSRYLEMTHKHDMKLDFDLQLPPGESGENMKMWAVSEIVQVFDKELQLAFENLEALSCEQDQEDAQVDDEAETTVGQYRQAAQKMQDKIRQLLSIFQAPSDANQTNQRQIGRQAEQYSPIFVGQQNINVENTQKIIVLERLSPLRLVQMLKTPANIERLPIQDSLKQQLQADVRLLQHTTMQLINQVCDIRDDVPHNYNQLCLSAIVSQLKIMASLGSQTPQELRVEIAYFILKACVTSNEAAMMIFSGEGYKILTNFLSIDQHSGQQQDSLSENRILVYIAIDVFLLHFSPMLNHCLPTRKVLQSIFLKEQIHLKLGHILEKLCQDDQDATAAGSRAGRYGPDAQQYQMRTGDLAEEKQVEAKYVDKVFELLGYLIHGTTFQNKIDFSTVIEKSLVKIVQGGIDRNDLSETTIAGKATRRLLKLVTQLIIGVPHDAIGHLPIFQLRSQEQSPENQSQVISWLVSILKLYASSLSAPHDQQQVPKSSQLTLLYDTLKLLSTLSSQSQSICLQIAQCSIDQTLAPLTTHILSLSPPLSLTKSLKLLSHLLSLLRNVRRCAAMAATSGPPPLPSTPQGAGSAIQLCHLEPQLLLQLLKFVHGHLIQIQAKTARLGGGPLGLGQWPPLTTGQGHPGGGQKAREKVSLLCQIFDDAMWLGLDGYEPSTGAQAQQIDRDETEEARTAMLEAFEILERVQDVIGSFVAAGAVVGVYQGQGPAQSGHGWQWEQAAKVAGWAKVMAVKERAVRIAMVRVAAGVIYNQKIDTVIRRVREMIELQAQLDGQEREDYAAMGPEGAQMAGNKHHQAQLTNFVQSSLKLIEVCLFKGIDDLREKEAAQQDKSSLAGVNQIIQEHLDTDIVSDSSSEQEGRNKVLNSRYFVDYVKRYLNTMPESTPHGNSLIGILRWIKAHFDKEQEIQILVNAIIDPIIKAFEHEGEHIPQPLFDNVCDDSKMLIHSGQMVKDRSIKMQSLPTHKHNSSEHQQQALVPQRTKNKSQNLVIKNASRHFVQNHEVEEEEQMQLIQQVKHQQKMQGKKMMSQKLNTYKPKQHGAQMVESYNSACNAKRAPPMMTAHHGPHQHLMFPPQQDFGQGQLYQDVQDTHFYQSMPHGDAHSHPQEISTRQQHQIVTGGQRQPKNQGMRQQQQMVKNKARQEMSVIKYVNQHRNRQMMGAGTSPPPRYQASQIAHSANNTGYVGQMNMSSAMRRRQQYFQHHESGIANENQAQTTAGSSLSNKHYQTSQHTHGSHSQQRRAANQDGGSRQGKVRNRQQSSNSHQGNHGLSLHQSDVQYQSANQQKASQHLHPPANPSNLMLLCKPKVQKVFKQQHATLNPSDQPPAPPHQLHSSTSSHHHGSTQQPIQPGTQQQPLQSSHSTQLPHTRTSTQSASTTLVGHGGARAQHAGDTALYAPSGGPQHAGASAALEQQPERQPVQRKLLAQPGGQPQRVAGDSALRGGGRPVGSGHQQAGQSKGGGQQVPQGRAQMRMDEALPRKAGNAGGGGALGGQRSAQGGQRGGRKGVGGVRVARGNNTQSMNVMNFQSLEHVQARVLTEQAFHEGSESHGQRGKVASSQYKYVQSSMQRPLATEPAGGYSREFHNQLGDIEEGEESGDCGGLNNIENSTEEDEFNLGGNYFVYEKHVQSPKNKKNATTGFGASLQPPPMPGLFNNPVQGQQVANPGQVLRSKSRDGAARNRAHAGLIPAQGQPNLFKNNSQLGTKMAGPGALMKSNDETPTFPAQSQVQQSMVFKKLPLGTQAPMADNQRHQQPSGPSPQQLYNSSMNLNNLWQTEMAAADAQPMQVHYAKPFGQPGRLPVGQPHQYMPLHPFASPQSVPSSVPRKMKHGGAGGHQAPQQHHVSGMYLPPQHQQWSNQQPPQPQQQAVYSAERSNMTAGGHEYPVLRSQEWMDEEDDEDEEEDEDGSEDDYGQGFQEMDFTMDDGKNKTQDGGEVYNAEEWTFSGQAHPEQPHESNIQSVSPGTFYHQQYYQQYYANSSNGNPAMDQMPSQHP